MKKLTLLFSVLITIILTEAQTIIVPVDYPEIQQAIEAAESGDTILVEPGIYYMPVNFIGKNLVITSMYLQTQDTSYISQTIIDGSSENQCVTFNDDEDSTALLCGFTIQNGYSTWAGGGIGCINSSPTLSDLIIRNCKARSNWDGIGGGIYCSNSSLTLKKSIIENCDSYFGGGVYLQNCKPVFINVDIRNNNATANMKCGGPETGIGGGIYCGNNTFAIFDNVTITGNNADIGGGIHWGNDTTSFFADVTIKNNIATESGGGLHMHDVPPVFDETNRCNIYNNSARLGHDIYRENYQESFHLVLDTFSVLYPTDYYIHSIKNLTYDINVGLIDLVDADLYISPDGNDENTGLTGNDPLKTIDHAFSLIRVDSMHPHTLYLGDGIYSDSLTGELFPVYIMDHITLKGNSRQNTILNAHEKTSVLIIDDNNSTVVSDITLTGGFGPNGGGIVCNNSTALFDNMNITGNYAYGDGWFDEPGHGGGLYLASSTVTIKNCKINNNIAFKGAGVYLSNTNAIFDSIIVTENTNNITNGSNAKPLHYLTGGGGIFSYKSDLSLMNSIIQENKTPGTEGYYGWYSYGGGLYLFESNALLNNVLVTGNLSEYGGGVYFSENTTGTFENVTITVNDAERGGAIYWDNNMPFVFDETNRCNIYNNRALYGNDLFAEKTMHVVVDTFSVLYPTEYFADPYEKFTFDIQNGKIEQVNADLYVSPDGNNNNDGLSEENPLQSIHRAISKMQVDGYNQHNIHLLPGTYNVSETNEFFPINLPEFISLVGAGDSTTIIDAEHKSEVLIIDYNQYNKISDLTLTGGNSFYEHNQQIGSAINCVGSSPELTNLTLTANEGFTTLLISDHSAPSLYNIDVLNNLTSGIYCSDFSEPDFENVNISGNQFKDGNHGVGISCINQSNAQLKNVNILNNITVGGNSIGGGFCCINSSPSLHNVDIADNQSNIGGGLYISDNSSPNLDSVVISNNDGGMRGGGLYVSDSDPIFDVVKIISNTAHYGGGIYFDGDCNHDVYSTIEVSHNNAMHGGGIYLSGENMSLENMMIFENEATSNGGGILMHGGAHFLSGLTIKNNVAEKGGGIDFNDYRVFFDSYEKCNIYMNNAAYGADLFAVNLVVPINVIADTFTVLYPNDNHAYLNENFTFNIMYGMIEQVDADLYLSPFGDNENSGLSPEEPLKNLDYAMTKIIAREDNPNTIYLEEGTYSPSQTGEGFPIRLIDHVNLVGTSRDNVILDAEGGNNAIKLENNTSNTISDLTITGSVGYRGAINCINSNSTLERLNITHNEKGMRINSSKPIIRDVWVANNDNEGLEFYGVSEGKVENCLIEENGRAGIDVNSSTLQITGVSVFSNEGNGIYCNESELTVEDVQIADNTGRGFSCKNSDIVLTSAAIYNNQDGGLFTSYSDAVLNNVTLENNSTNIKGGGMYVHVTNMEADSLNIINNTSPLGGGIYDFHSELNLTNSFIVGNEASEEGGGIYGSTGITNIVNTLIANNTAPNGGGVYSFFRYDLNLVNSTVVQNISDLGGAIYGWYYVYPKITNSILWNNTEPNIYFDGRVESYIDISWSDIQGGEESIVTNEFGIVNWLEGNIDDDPLFMDTGEFEFALSDESPCINAGNPDTSGFILPEIDLLGNPRIWSGRVDMGAVEWNSLGIFDHDGTESKNNVRCYPNPLSTSTTIEYELNQPETVSITFYNQFGKQVDVIEESQQKGLIRIVWTPDNLADGIYYYKLNAGGQKANGKLVLMGK